MGLQPHTWVTGGEISFLFDFLWPNIGNPWYEEDRGCLDPRIIPSTTSPRIPAMRPFMLGEIFRHPPVAVLNHAGNDQHPSLSAKTQGVRCIRDHKNEYLFEPAPQRVALQDSSNIWVLPKIWVPQNGWVYNRKPFKMDDVGIFQPCTNNRNQPNGHRKTRPNKGMGGSKGSKMWVNSWVCRVDVGWGPRFFGCLVVSTCLQNVGQNGNLPQVYRDENKTCLKPPPSCLVGGWIS